MAWPYIAALFFPILYVAPFRLLPGNRDDPRVVAFRSLSAFATVFLGCWPLTLWALRSQDGSLAPLMAEALGLLPARPIAACVYPLLLMAVLFAGPIALDVQELLRGRALSSFFPPTLPQTFRNLLVAPLTEEFVFRAGLISFLLARGESVQRCLWLSPLYFGIAHIHHATDVERQRLLGVRAAVLSSVAQALYSTVFGWYAAGTFLATGSIAACVLPHALCNLLGFPRFSKMLSRPYIRLALFGGILGFVAGCPLVLSRRLYDK